LFEKTIKTELNLERNININIANILILFHLIIFINSMIIFLDFDVKEPIILIFQFFLYKFFLIIIDLQKINIKEKVFMM
jgi:hypothetical protein